MKLDLHPTNTTELNKKASVTTREKTPEDKKIEKVANDFESIFVSLMLKSMRKSVDTQDKSNAQHIYKSMLDQEYSKTIANSSNLGLAEQIVSWIKENNLDMGKVSGQVQEQQQNLKQQAISNYQKQMKTKI